MRFSCIAVAVLCIIGGPARAAHDYSSGNFYLPYCEAFIAHKYDNVMGGACMGMVTGISSISRWLSPELRSCPPGNAVPLQGLAVVVKYMKDHPERLNMNFSVLIVGALKDAWPCK